MAAIHEALVTVTKPADRQFTVRDIHFEKVGRWIVMRAKLRNGSQIVEFTVRMPRARAESLRLRLTGLLS